MPTILGFLPAQDLSEPTDLAAMAAALDDLLERLELDDDGSTGAANARPIGCGRRPTQRAEGCSTLAP